MNFQAEIEIGKPVDELIALFQDPEVTLKWLEGLKSVKHISGEMRQPGAQSRVVFESPAGRMFLTETVISNGLPDEYIIRYEGDGYVSYSNYQFVSLGQSETRFIINQHVELKGALKLVSGLLKGTVNRQLQRSTVCFKRFAENQ